MPDFARTVVASLEGSLAFPLSTRFFGSVLTVPFSAFLTCHSIPPLRTTNDAVSHAVILSGRKGKCVPDFARTVVASLEGSLASPLSARFFGSVLTVPFSAFFACHSIPPLRMTNGTVPPHAVILSGRKEKCVPDFARTVVDRVEGSLAFPLSTRFFDSVLTVPFSAFLTCHSIPPQMTDRGEIGRQRRSEGFAGQIGEIIRKRGEGERGCVKELAADVERL